MKIVFAFFFIFFLIILFFPLPRLSPPFGTLLYDKEGKIIYGFLAEDGQWRFPIEEKEEIPFKIKKTIILSEDKRYYFHLGFDPFTLLRATYVNLKNKKILQGGSTITMQLVRILDPKPRKISSKIKEIIQAIKLEILYSKEKILKLYLSSAPFGGNVSGIKAASLKYFGKEERDLTWAECATITALLKSPSKANLEKRRDILKNRRDFILKKLYEKKYIDKDTLNHSLMEPLPEETFPLPKNAPHFSFLLMKNKVGGNFKTSLDLNLQKLVEKIGENYYPKLLSLCITSFSIVVIETKTGKVRAYMGSPSFERERDGQVDGVQAPRSTGSILKPFLYALCLDEGIALPETILPDFPMHFGNFYPANSEKKYFGAVTFKDALTNSLNVPAVWLLQKYGVEKFYNFLKKLEFSYLNYDYTRYGLTLILGGAEGSLIEITNAYRIFSNNGLWSPYTFEERENKIEKRVLSEGSSSLIYDILLDLKRPDEKFYPLYPEKNSFAWKTGTSFKQRDGWAIGTNPSYTIGVWVGNFSGRGNQNIMGASVAGPLLFYLFSSIPNMEKKEIEMKGLEKVLICKESGYISKEECPNLVFSFKPKEAKNIPLCPYHKKYYTDLEEKYLVCSIVWGSSGYKEKIFFLLSPKMKFYRELLGEMGENLPTHNPSCKKLQSGKIKIIYPEGNTLIKIPIEYDGKLEKIVCKASSNSKSKNLYWLLDKNYLGKTEGPHTITINASEGKHLLQIIDENANEDSVIFNIIKSNL